MSSQTPGDVPGGPSVNHGFQQFGGHNRIGAMAVGPGARAVSGGGAEPGGEDDRIRAFIEEYLQRLPELRQEQSAEALEQIAPRVETVRRQIDSPEPEKHLLKDVLASIRAVLEHGLGGVATTALLALLSQIRL
ncbi:hypothetical protein GXW83_23305 [Streptacidiphilus sp. PB12-B1b]|uniref:hypothetical protein n=1 Tax=Streptacidiphilus sp. PB12-B1b TaxID=2705012 RepID=UPI0015FB2F71|nr:hypothetical protein [Streptacidiphilus sp. PB12-B1b]QMU78193.1 hypothetical protein GXW83_23305 [Streptacidiphilus sp. PB12-B1b]